MTPFELTRSVRALNRLRQVAMVLTRHGFGHVVAQIQLTKYLPVWMLRKKAAPTEETPPALGRRIAAVCSELGPTFVKLGQLLSTRPDIVPSEVLAELRALQDKVPPFDTSHARSIILADLGKPVEACFERFEETPFASASIGQVYSARLPDGRDVVVKVRRPGIEDVIRLDMQLLRWLARSLEELTPEVRAYRPSLMVSELEEMLTRELDYINEASVTSRFHEALSGADGGVVAPSVVWELCSERVLTQEKIAGRNVEKLLRSDDPKSRFDRKLVARRIADSFLRQVFEFGLFHADLHPGNILVNPPARVGLIDYGQVGSISEELMAELLALVYACVNHEMDVVIDTLADLGAIGRTTDRRQVHRALDVLIGKYYGLPIRRFQLGTLFAEFSDIMRRNDVVIPREFATLLKAAGTVGGVITLLDPELDLLELVAPRIRSAMKSQFSPKTVSRKSALAAWDLFSIVRQAPRQLRAILRRVSTAGWEMTVRHENLDRLTRELDRSSNRMAFAIVIAGIIVGSSVVFSAATDMRIFGIGIQYFGIAGYLIAALLGLGLSWAIFRSGRLH